MLKADLDAIERHLLEQGLQCRREEAGEEEDGQDYLVLDLAIEGEDYPPRLMLSVSKEKLELPDAERPQTITILHLGAVYPFQVEEETVGELARYLLLVNKSLDFPGFGLSEVDRAVYYRHKLHCSLGQVSEEFLTGVVGNIALMLDAFSPNIQRIVAGEANLEDIISEAQGSQQG